MSLDPFEVWVRRSGQPIESAIRFVLARTSTVSELLLEAHQCMWKPSLEPPQNVELLLDGVSLSNFTPLCDLRTNTALTDSIPRIVLELRRRFRRTTVPAHRSDGGAVNARPTTPRRAKSPTSTSGATPTPASPADCVFAPQWSNALCAKCGAHRRFHTHFPPNRVEIQDRLIQSLNRSPSPLSRFRKSPKRLWDPVSKRTKTPEKPLQACDHFRAVWNRPGFCLTCGHPSDLHTSVAQTEERPRTVSPSPSKARERAAHFLQPTVGTVAKLRAPVTCSNFAPLWNHNSYCAHCYQLQADHRSRTPSRRKPRHGRPVAVGDPLSIAKFCAIPWHYVLTFCDVETLLVSGQVCRLLTLASRPLLHSTMTIVLSFDEPLPTDAVREVLMEVAELLVDSRPSLIAETLRDLCAKCLGTTRDKLRLDSVGDALVALRKIINPKQNRGVVTLPKEFGQKIANAESLYSVVSKSAPDEALIALPVLQYFRTMWTRYHVVQCAQRYLAQDQIVL